MFVKVSDSVAYLSIQEWLGIVLINVTENDKDKKKLSSFHMSRNNIIPKPYRFHTDLRWLKRLIFFVRGF